MGVTRLSVCDSYLEGIDHLFKQYDFVRKVWSNLTNLYRTPINDHVAFLDWIDFI